MIVAQKDHKAEPPAPQVRRPRAANARSNRFPHQHHIPRHLPALQQRVPGKIHEVPHIPGSVGESNIEIIHESHTSISEFISDVAGYARAAVSRRTRSTRPKAGSFCQSGQAARRSRM